MRKIHLHREGTRGKSLHLGSLGSLLCLCFALCLLLTSMRAHGQSTTGSVYGTVTDVSGAAVAGAVVSITDTEKHISQTARTNANGEYLFPTLNPGLYDVSTSVKGFTPVIQSGIALSANQNIHANFTLSPGGSNESVTVEAGTTGVDTREAQLAETIDQKKIQDLPLNGRSPYDLVNTLPGVTNYSADTPIGARNGTRFSINGLPASTTNFYLDGAQDIAISAQTSGGNILPNPDALQEVRVLTSNFDAEFGRSPGGVMSSITRSGTSKFHGLIYDYLRNDKLNAAREFVGQVTPLKQNQFGADLGGPLWRGGKAFFFLSYEGLIIHTPSIVPSTLITLTSLERTGDFTASTVKPKLPAGTNCGTAAAPVICRNALDPVAQNLLVFVPVYNAATGTSVQQSAPANSDTNQGLARVDYQLTPAHQLEAMFFTSRGTQTNPAAVGNQILSYSGMNNYQNTDNAVIADTWIVSPRMVNAFRGFYTQNRSIISPMYPSHTWASLGSTVVEGGPIFAPPDFVITGYFNEGTNQGGPNDISQLAFGPIDTLTMTLGHHNLKVGGGFVWNKYDSNGGFQDNGIVTFSGSITGSPIADFLLGRANSLIQNTPQIQRTHIANPSIFAQDTWTLNPRLTLNLGLRWEVTPAADTGDEGTFAPLVQSHVFPNAPIGLLFPGDPGIPPGIYNTPYTNLAPRVGFAYDLFGHGKTGLRGGFGIFFSSDYELSATSDQPYTLSVTTNKTPNLVAPYAPNPDPFPYVVTPGTAHFTSGANTAAIPPNGGSTPYVYEYNLTLEQQFGVNWSTRISYVGNSGHKFYVNHDINAPVYAPGAATSTAGINARRPYQPTPSSFIFGGITLRDPIDDTHYDSLQATIKNNITHRSSLLASYVWSKAIDYGYGDGFVNGTDVRMQRGLADIDQRNTFVASYVYELPGTRRLGAFGRQALSGWQINGITSLHSGGPYTVTSGVDTNLDGTVNDRPNVIGNTFLPTSRTRAQKIAQYYNPKAFATPTVATGPYGNEQRNFMIGPGYVNTNISVFKQFTLTERARLQFRAEAFNAYGNVNLNNPISTLTSPKVAQITGAGTPRILQFALKALF